MTEPNTKFKFEDFMEDLNNYLNSMYVMNNYIQTINEKINKKEEEIQDFSHYNEFLNLSNEEKVKYYDFFNQVLDERRNLKDIKSMLTVLNNTTKELDINKKSTIKTVERSLKDKVKSLTEDRYYNIRSQNSIEYLEKITDTNIKNDFIKKGMSKEDLNKEKEKTTCKKPLSENEIDRKIKNITNNK